MKRIHLFEFEDLHWFPEWLRKCLTRMMVVMHKLLNTADEMSELVGRGLVASENNTIIDLCSGSGGPMPAVLETLKNKSKMQKIRLIMTDLYPNLEYAREINKGDIPEIKYLTEPVDAANVDVEMKGLRTLVGSLHHMKPEIARKILKNAMDSKQSFLAIEISDNSYPKALWWLAIPFNIISSLFISAMARPYSFQQFFFTYLFPIIPFTFAWDGAVSNARTYTLNDLKILLEGLDSEYYTWEKGIINGKSKKIYLRGLPKKNSPMAQ